MELNIRADIDNKPKSHVADTAGAVLQDFVGGMYDELKNNPGKLAAEAAAAAVATVGIAASPLPGIIKTGLKVAGAGMLIHEGAVGAMNLADQTSIINNFDGTKTAEQINAAHEKIGQMGATAVNFGAFAAGGALGMETMRIGIGVGSPIPFSDGIGLRSTAYDAQVMMGAKKLLSFEK
ncbi:MAG TPA: hypothetical protein V6C76_12410 [Drouetiella sp.]